MTVSGPNPNQPCVFPFRYKNKVYSGCDTDPDDPTKTWCSTKTDQDGNHIIGQNEYGHCAANCPRQPIDSDARIGPVASAPLKKCMTVSGPNPGKPCVFPFIYDGRSYSGCPIDPDDSSKRWCSTKVDDKGQHVPKQNEYGHCASNCPKSNPTNQSLGKCSSGKCRPFSACAAQTQNRVTCTQSDGSSGLCCKDINSNRPNSVLTIRGISSDGQDISSVPQRTINDAVTYGQSFAQNVTKFKNQIGNYQRGTPEFFHTQFLKARDDNINVLSRAALTSAFAAKRLEDQVSNTLTFRQIGFANADVSNTVLSRACTPEPRCNFQSRYRKLDGSCNNPFKPKYGQLKTPVQRVLPNAYFDGVLSPRRDTRGRPLPSARLVSTSITSQTSSPSRINTVMLMALGQFIDHDLTHVPMKNDNGRPIDCCSIGNRKFDSTEESVCFPIQIPPNDRFYKGKRTCMNFARSEGCLDINCQPGPLQQINQITHWLDSSNVYVSDTEEGEKLRSKRSGLLKTSRALDGSELLPPNTKECLDPRGCFLAGDSRVNEQPNLAVMHTLFVREHNRVARQLANYNPRWNDEKLYQETRRIVNAQWQHIVYNEWLPIILGQRYMTSFGLFPLTDGFSSNYRNDFDPRITNAFATAAFRIGHSLVPGLIK